MSKTGMQDEAFECDGCHIEFPYHKLIKDGEWLFCPQCWEEMEKEEEEREGLDEPEL